MPLEGVTTPKYSTGARSTSRLLCYVQKPKNLQPTFSIHCSPSLGRFISSLFSENLDLFFPSAGVSLNNHQGETRGIRVCELHKLASASLLYSHEDISESFSNPLIERGYPQPAWTGKRRREKAWDIPKNICAIRHNSPNIGLGL